MSDKIELLAQVGPRTLADGQQAMPRLGRTGEWMTDAIYGSWYEQVMRGNGYVFTTALAGNALVAATTTNAPAIWNPANSGRALVIQKITFGRTAVGTPLEGDIVYLFQPVVQSFGATGADIVSATFVAAKNLRLDLGDNSGVKFAPTTITTTFTPSLLATSGISQAASTGTTTGVQTFMDVDMINGSIVLTPGTYFSIGAAVSLSSTYCVSIYALSIPVVLQSA